MPVNTKPPTRTIVPLISSVERQKGPNLSRRCSIRVPTKALRNALGVSSKLVPCDTLSSEEKLARAYVCSRSFLWAPELPFGQPTSFSFLHSRSTGVLQQIFLVRSSPRSLQGWQGFARWSEDQRKKIFTQT
jgi:hypothetical protein